PITAIEHGQSGVTVHYTEYGDRKSLEAEYLVCALPMSKLKDLPVQPAWSEAKDYVIRNVVFSTQARVVFQCRTPFWEGDRPSGPSCHLGVGRGGAGGPFDLAGHGLLEGQRRRSPGGLEQALSRQEPTDSGADPGPQLGLGSLVGLVRTVAVPPGAVAPVLA